MATKKCYYEVLSVSKDASDREISTSYRKLAVKYHPDSNQGDNEATAKFKEAAEAYEVLSDSDKRARYNQYGHAGVDGAGSQFGSNEDIFEAFGDLFGGGMFGDLFGGGRRGKRVRKGSDIRVDLTLTLEEAASGINKTLKFPRSKECESCSGAGSAPGSTPETCPGCGGQGQVLQSAGILRVQTTCPHCRGAGKIITDPCKTCGGDGQSAENVTLDVAIPAGVDDGMRVRISGEGEASPDGGPSGDCYCFISVKTHKIFQRDGRNLVLRLPISYTQAVLGSKIDVPTLDGPTELEVPKGTQSGEVFKLHGKGLPDPSTGARHGDLLVQTYVETPKKLTLRQEELLRELADEENANVSPHRKSFLEKIKTYFAPQEDALHE